MRNDGRDGLGWAGLGCMIAKEVLSMNRESVNLILGARRYGLGATLRCGALRK